MKLLELFIVLRYYVAYIYPSDTVWSHFWGECLFGIFLLLTKLSKVDGFIELSETEGQE